MHLKSIHIYRFRNYTEQQIEFSPETNLITGDNGQGKTNLLEAIHYCCLGHSPRTRKDKDLIRWEAEDFILRIEGVSRDGRLHTQSVLFKADGTKEIRKQGEASKRLSDLIGSFSVVFFSPSDLDLVNGSPGSRRKFLDALMCQHSPEYLITLRNYQRTLKQRNVVLKEEAKYTLDVLEALNEQLLEYGAEIIFKRLKFLERLGPLSHEFYARSGGKGSLSITYEGEGEYPFREKEAIKAVFYKKMLKVQAYEKVVKTSLIGPHKDNLLILLSDKKAVDFGSQGQKRLIALSLKLASAKSLETKFQEPPILLLDDVFAELDEARRSEVSSMMTESGQVFLATPREEDIPFSFQQVVRIKEGELDN